MFYVDRMVEFCEFNDVRPRVNQMETHPLNQQAKLMAWEARYHVQPEAWAPFGEGRGGLFENPVLAEIGAAHGKSAAQVMLLWNLRRGVIVLPKSYTALMEENLNVLDLAFSEDAMARIVALDTQTSSFFDHRDPETVRWFAQMVEERKRQHDSPKEKKNW